MNGDNINYFAISFLLKKSLPCFIFKSKSFFKHVQIQKIFVSVFLFLESVILKLMNF